LREESYASFFDKPKKAPAITQLRMHREIAGAIGF